MGSGGGNGASGGLPLDEACLQGQEMVMGGLEGRRGGVILAGHRGQPGPHLGTLTSARAQTVNCELALALLLPLELLEP